MKAPSVGIWATSHWILDLTGKGAVWLLHAKTTPHDDEAYAMTGGAIFGAVFGAIIGFLFSPESYILNPIDLMIVGSLLGICTGIMWGAIVQIVDDYIDAAIKSSNSC